ncbi:MAG: hypothetical protein ACXVH1_05015 [Solirubrobacteraceae bacterium]
MRRFASGLAAFVLVSVLMCSAPTPANAGALSGAAHIVTSAGGAILSVGKGVLCKGLSATGKVAAGAGAVAGGAASAPETGGAGTAAGAAAGGAVGGVIKKGVGVVSKVVCSAGGASSLAKAAVGAVAAAATFDLAARWMIDAARKVTLAIVSTITNSTSPQLTAAWFQRSFSPMLALGATLALLVTLIALTSAAVRRDPSALAATLMGILRAGVGAGLVIALTSMALQITDAVSADVIRSSHQTFWSQVGHAWGASGFGGFGSSALAMLMAILQVIAGVIVWLELAVRNAAIYLAVMFFPVALAASICPALAGWSSRLARLLLVFVILKPVCLIVLAFAGNAALAGLSLNGGLASSAGTIIAAVTIFALAAMAPWALMLIVAADSESAWSAAGVRAAAGHARSDGAATLGRVGGKIRGAGGRASGRLGAVGGAIGGGAGFRRGGGGSSSSGGSGAPGGGGRGPSGPPGDASTASGGGPAPESNGSGPGSIPRGQTARAASGTQNLASSRPRGAVAFAAGLSSSGARSGSHQGGQHAAAPAQSPSGGGTRAPARRPSRGKDRPSAHGVGTIAPQPAPDDRPQASRPVGVARVPAEPAAPRSRPRNRTPVTES